MSLRRTGRQKAYLHYDPERVDYSATDEELIRLRDAGRNPWRDSALVSFSIGLPCLINGIAATNTPFVYSLAVLLNYLFGVVGVALSLVFLWVWRCNRQDPDEIINSIKAKPRLEVTCLSASSGKRSVELIDGTIESSASSTESATTVDVDT